MATLQPSSAQHRSGEQQQLLLSNKTTTIISGCGSVMSSAPAQVSSSTSSPYPFNGYGQQQQQHQYQNLLYGKHHLPVPEQHAPAASAQHFHHLNTRAATTITGGEVHRHQVPPYPLILSSSSAMKTAAYSPQRILSSATYHQQQPVEPYQHQSPQIHVRSQTLPVPPNRAYYQQLAPTWPPVWPPPPPAPPVNSALYTQYVKSEPNSSTSQPFYYQSPLPPYGSYGHPNKTMQQLSMPSRTPINDNQQTYHSNKPVSAAWPAYYGSQKAVVGPQYHHNASLHHSYPEIVVVRSGELSHDDDASKSKIHAGGNSSLAQALSPHHQTSGVSGEGKTLEIPPYPSKISGSVIHKESSSYNHHERVVRHHHHHATIGNHTIHPHPYHRYQQKLSENGFNRGTATLETHPGAPSSFEHTVSKHQTNGNRDHHDFDVPPQKLQALKRFRNNTELMQRIFSTSNNLEENVAAARYMKPTFETTLQTLRRQSEQLNANCLQLQHEADSEFQQWKQQVAEMTAKTEAFERAWRRARTYQVFPLNSLQLYMQKKVADYMQEFEGEKSSTEKKEDVGVVVANETAVAGTACIEAKVQAETASSEPVIKSSPTNDGAISAATSNDSDVAAAEILLTIQKGHPTVSGAPMAGTEVCNDSGIGASCCNSQ